MSSNEPFNFGRKIKELKKLNKKGYAELTTGLQISRDRIIQLEENEREPNDVERRRFAAYYNLPPEEFGVTRGEGQAQPSPAFNNYGPPALERRFDNAPPIQSGERLNQGYQGDNLPFQPERRTPNVGPETVRPSYNNPNNNPGPERRSNFAGNEMRPPFGGNEGSPGSDGERRSSFNQDSDRRPPFGGGDGDRRPPFGGGRPAQGGQRPPFGGRPGNPAGGRTNNPGGGGRPDQGNFRRDAGEPKEAREPKEPRSSENKPVMKYTAEQLGDIESAYLRKQRDLKVALTFTFLNGKSYTGVVTDFTPFTVHIQDAETGEEVILRKLAMAYYRKADAVPAPKSGAQPEKSETGRAGEEG